MKRFVQQCFLDLLGVFLFYILVAIILNLGGFFVELFQNFFSNIPLVGTTLAGVTATMLIVLSLKKTITHANILIVTLIQMYEKYKKQIESIVQSPEGRADKKEVLKAVDDFTESLSGVLRTIKAPKKYIVYLKGIVKESDYKNL